MKCALIGFHPPSVGAALPDRLDHAASRRGREQEEKQREREGRREKTSGAKDKGQ